MNGQTPWDRLAAAARRAPDDRDFAAPYGFASRVAAQAMDAQSRASSPWSYFSPRVSLRAAGAAFALAAVMAGANYPTLRRLLSAEAVPPVAALSAGLSASQSPPPAAPASSPATGDDPVAELVDAVS